MTLMQPRSDPVLEAVRRALLRSLVLKAEFDPAQPRDEQGRWTDTGGGEGGSDAEASTDISAQTRGGGIPRALCGSSSRDTAKEA